MGEAPFKPGDKVVHINADDDSGIKQGQVYTIDSVHWCCNEIKWRVYLTELSMAYNWRCCDCHKYAPGWPAENFRKIDDISNHTADSLLKELSEPIRELQSV